MGPGRVLLGAAAGRSQIAEDFEERVGGGREERQQAGLLFPGGGSEGRRSRE